MTNPPLKTEFGGLNNTGDKIAGDTGFVLSAPARSDLTQHQSRVLTPKGDAVRKRVLAIDSPRFVWDVVEVALGVRVLKVDGRRRNAIAHGEQSGSYPRLRKRPEDAQSDF